MSEPLCVKLRGHECGDCVECLSKHPEGKTCADCVHANLCRTVFGVPEPETRHFCQWYPSRFHAAPARTGEAE